MDRPSGRARPACWPGRPLKRQVLFCIVATDRGVILRIHYNSGSEGWFRRGSVAGMDRPSGRARPACRPGRPLKRQVLFCIVATDRGVILRIHYNQRMRNILMFSIANRFGRTYSGSFVFQFVEFFNQVYCWDANIIVLIMF